MKKVSTLLLTGLIGSSMLFAGFSGSAKVENKLFDFTTNEFGFTNSTSLEAEVELYASTAEVMGEGDIYAEITADLVVKTDSETTTGATVVNIDTLEVTSANVVGDGWKVSILGPNGPVDYAADTIVVDSDNDEVYNYSATGTTVDGVAVTLDDLGTVSVGYKGDLDTSTAAYVALEAAEMEVAEGITAQVAGSLYYDQASANIAAGSVKVAYAKDDMAASLALDAGYQASKVDMDAKLNVAMSPVTFDAYFGTKNTNGDFTTDAGDYNASTNVLHVQAVTDLNSFDVPVVLTVKGLDLVTARDLKASADVTLTDELSACVSGGFGLVSKAWDVGVSATYAVDAYTLAAEVTYNGDLGANASIESTTLVDGATLSLAWDGATDLVGKVFGSVVAACEIEF